MRRKGLKIYTVPYGKPHIQFDLLPGMQGEEIHSQGLPPFGDLDDPCSNHGAGIRMCGLTHRKA